MANLLFDSMMYPPGPFISYAVTAAPGWSISASVTVGNPGRFSGTYAAGPTGNGNTFFTVPNLVTGYVGWALQSFLSSAATFLTFQNGNNIMYQVGINSAGFVVVYNNANVIVGTSAYPIAFSQWYYLEASLVVDNTIGSIIVRAHNVPIVTITGIDTTYGGAYTVFDRICWYSGQFFQDVYINDDTTASNNTFEGEITSRHFVPTADGSLVQWTPSAGANFENVDDAVPGFDFDGSYNEANSVGLRDLFTKPAVTLITGQTIKAVQVTALARKVDPGTRKLALVTKSGATVNLSPDKDLATTYGEFRDTLVLDPATGLPWTLAAVNAAEVGYEITV
jgi:hypothetical protein